MGWLLHNKWNQEQSLPSSQPTPDLSSAPYLSTNFIDLDIKPKQRNPKPPTTTQENIVAPFEFMQALDDNRIDDALVMYQQFERSSPKEGQIFRNALEEWLDKHEAETRNNVLERFSHHYYQDEKLLIQLADNLEKQDKWVLAIETLLNLRSFIIVESKLESLNTRIHTIVQKLYHQRFKNNQPDTILELLQRLHMQESDYSFYRFALSQIYLSLGDNENAIRELEVLQLDPEFSQRAIQILAVLLPPTIVNEPKELPTGSIPLTSINGHYIVKVSVGVQESTHLLIDTGASLTTLPSDVLQRLRRKKLAVQVGHTHLKTAGGLQFAPIYQLKELHIGLFIVRNLQVAQLNLQDTHSQGLLGMDVLSQFRFQLDQDRGVLSLQQR